jgi:hypothetical protein
MQEKVKKTVDQNSKQQDGKNNYKLKLLNNKLKTTCEQKKTNIKGCSKNRAETI